MADAMQKLEKPGEEDVNPGSEAMLKKMKEDKERFTTIVKQYLDGNPHMKIDHKTQELEVRFGSNTRTARPISKLDYDNVVAQLLASGFKSTNVDGTQILRITSETDNKMTGATQMSNIRAEIVGTDMIQEYCKSNNLQNLIDLPSFQNSKLKFTRKAPAFTKDGKKVDILHMNDFNFSVAHKTEQDYNIQSNVGRNIILSWTNSKKTFRCLNRVRFAHPDYPIFADISIVKSSKTANRIQIPEYTVQDAGVFNNLETYEVELEIDNSRVGTSTAFANHQALLAALRKCIMTVLSGLQNTKYPISYFEQNQILQAYMKMVHGEEYVERRIKSKDFVGPQPVTLQMENIQPKPDGSVVPTILEHFTVTEKADGDRKMLFVNGTGRVYLIDNNMNVTFTGTKTNDKSLFYSLIDGEHIKHNVLKENINLYAAFDIYYIGNQSVRDFAFYNTTKTDEFGEPRAQQTQQTQSPLEEGEIREGGAKQGQAGAGAAAGAIKTKYRLDLLNDVVQKLRLKSVLENKDKGPIAITDFRVQCKQFYSTEHNSIFEACFEIITKRVQGLFEYETDGLIFTHAKLAVGADRVGAKAGPIEKTTWKQNFKWKPPEFNTIDFLVTIKKDKAGKDEVFHTMDDGVQNETGKWVVSYKTLVLRCGFNEYTEDTYMNPFQDMLNDKLPTAPPGGRMRSNDDYKPVPFQPTNPYDINACFCNIALVENNNKKGMFSEEGEFFEENMIVEFKYVMENRDGWKWVPLRVRYDKTAELKAGQKNYGNAFHVANNNWQSIHNPITEDMISTGNNIPQQYFTEEVYYNRMNEDTSTKAMRDFHNLFVKQKLIVGVSRPDETLIDFAVGKAGDLSKWTTARLKFVLGVDLSKDNIHNKKDGACARYLNLSKKFPQKIKAIFVTGNIGINIRSGDAFQTEKEKLIVKALFKLGPKDESIIGKAVVNQYGIAETGFNVSSCQFAIHYLFENKTVLHNFLRNLVECTKINGYFVATCYDGKTVFDMLSKKDKEESLSIFKDDRKIFEITKMYDQTGFPDDDASLGYAINVYQESINKVFREYLVNFNYLVRLMENYGFILATKEDMVSMRLKNSSAMFKELFLEMEAEIEKNPSSKANYKSAAYMSPDEKQISFMNRYFIFKKVRTVDVAKIQEVLALQEKFVAKNGEKNIAEIEETIDNMRIQHPVSNIRKTGRKLVIKSFEPVPETDKTNAPELVPHSPTDTLPQSVIDEYKRRQQELATVPEPEPEPEPEKPVVAPTKMKIKVKKTDLDKK